MIERQTTENQEEPIFVGQFVAPRELFVDLFVFQKKTNLNSIRQKSAPKMRKERPVGWTLYFRLGGQDIELQGSAASEKRIICSAKAVFSTPFEEVA